MTVTTSAPSNVRRRSAWFSRKQLAPHDDDQGERNEEPEHESSVCRTGMPQL